MSELVNNSYNLKPCPFCGGNIQSFDETKTGWQINCWCGAAGPDGDTPEGAAEAWNRRAE